MKRFVFTRSKDEREQIKDKREQEAKKLGFTTCIMPAVSKKNLTEITGINIIGVNNIKEAEELI